MLPYLATLALLGRRRLATYGIIFFHFVLNIKLPWHVWHTRGDLHTKIRRACNYQRFLRIFQARHLVSCLEHSTNLSCHYRQLKSCSCGSHKFCATLQTDKIYRIGVCKSAVETPSYQSTKSTWPSALSRLETGGTQKAKRSSSRCCNDVSKSNR
jgi:hypothetical protein